MLSIPAPTICDGQQDQGISEDLYEAIDGDGCPIPPVTPSAPGDKASSPWTLTVAEPGQSARPPIANGTYFGILQFEASPNLRRPGELTSGGVDLHAGKDVKAQVQGGMQAIKGIVKCIINDWMDKQIRYVLNNLTNMTVGVYLPDVTDLLQ